MILNDREQVIFDAITEAFQASVESQCARTIALASLLLKKGVVTEMELKQEIAKAESDVDQLIATIRDEMNTIPAPN